VYLAGNQATPLWDRDEPRYAQASRQMARSGDWVVPMLLDEPRLKKPVLIYWLQAASMKILGETRFAARLPSAVGMVAVLAIVGLVGSGMTDQTRAWLAAFLLGTSVLAIAAAKMCITDAVLLVFILATQLCLYRLWMGERSWGLWAIMGLAIGLAMLTKGPVVLGVMGTTLLALAVFRWLDRRSFKPAESPLPSPGPRKSPLHWFGGIALASGAAMIVLLPWLLAMEGRIPGYTWSTLRDEVIARAGKPQEGHKGPPGYYLLTIWVSWFPWSAILPWVLVAAWKRRAAPWIRFSLAACIGPWLMLEAVQTKLPHYLLPVFPFLAFLTADWVIEQIRASTTGRRGLSKVWSAALALGWVGFGLSFLLIPWVPGLDPVPAEYWIGSGVLALVSVAGAIVLYRGVAAGKPWIAPAGLLVWTTVVVVTGLVVPQATFLQLSPRIAATLEAAGATQSRRILMIDYKEPSLAFEQGGTIRPERRNNYLQETPPSEWPDFLVLTAGIWAATDASIKEQWQEAGRLRGINYASDPTPVEVVVLRKR
jgi:4-amino-4-deoxy-L-arabinose transferase-like glycosyltransferase